MFVSVQSISSSYDLGLGRGFFMMKQYPLIVFILHQSYVATHPAIANNARMTCVPRIGLRMSRKSKSYITDTRCDLRPSPPT